MIMPMDDFKSKILLYTWLVREYLFFCLFSKFFYFHLCLDVLISQLLYGSVQFPEFCPFVPVEIGMASATYLQHNILELEIRSAAILAELTVSLDRLSALGAEFARVPFHRRRISIAYYKVFWSKAYS